VCAADGAPRSLILIEPARTADAAETFREFGLTTREAEVALAVVRGQPTRVITAALRISPYTVQDHVRHICDKLGVSSGRELGVRLLGSIAPAEAAVQGRASGSI